MSLIYDRKIEKSHPKLTNSPFPACLACPVTQERVFVLFAHNSTADMRTLLHVALVFYLCKNDTALENLLYGSIEVMGRMVFKMVSVFCGRMELKLNNLGWNWVPLTHCGPCRMAQKLLR